MEDGQRITLDIEGMSCASCAQRLARALSELPGVNEAQVNFAAEKAYVDYDPGMIDEDALKAAADATKSKKGLQSDLSSGDDLRSQCQVERPQR